MWWPKKQKPEEIKTPLGEVIKPRTIKYAVKPVLEDSSLVEDKTVDFGEPFYNRKELGHYIYEAMQYGVILNFDGKINRFIPAKYIKYLYIKEVEL